MKQRICEYLLRNFVNFLSNENIHFVEAEDLEKF